MKTKTVLITTWICIFSILFPVFSTLAEELDSTNYKIVDITTQGGGTTESTNYASLLTVNDTITDPRLYSTNYKMWADPASAFRPAVPTVSCFETDTDGYSNCTTGPSELTTGGMVALCGGDGCYNKARFEIGDAPYQYDTALSDLISYWPMDETSGSSVIDVVSSNDGTATGTSIVDGKYRKARSFNGSSDEITITNPSVAFSAGTVSVWALIQTSGVLGNGIIYTGYGAGETEYIGILTVNGNIRIDIDDGNDGCGRKSITSSGTNYADSEWHHIVLTFTNQDAGHLYIDGVESGSGISLSGCEAEINTTVDWKMGYLSSGNHFDGLIDEVLIFDNELDSTDILDLYSSSRPITNPSDTLYAVQISTDNFVSDIRYLDGSTNEPKSTVTLNDFRTKTAWETDTFNVLGLEEGTQYYLRIISLHGDFTQTEEGPPQTATTAGATSNFDIDIADTGGTSAETDPPFTISFTGDNSLLAGAAAVVADDLIWMDAQTNGSGGFSIVEKGENGGLYSSTLSSQINSVTGDLDALSEGFGLQSYYIDYDTGTGLGDITATTNYSGSSKNVGIVDTDWNKIYDADGPITNGRMALYLMARAGTDKQGATDYDETITFVFVPRY